MNEPASHSPTRTVTANDLSRPRLGAALKVPIGGNWETSARARVMEYVGISLRGSIGLASQTAVSPAPAALALQETHWRHARPSLFPPSHGALRGFLGNGRPCYP